MTDEQEVRYGITIAQSRRRVRGEASGVQLRQRDGETPTGVAHYDTKAEIERHIRRLPLAATDRAARHLYGAAGDARFWP